MPDHSPALDLVDDTSWDNLEMHVDPKRIDSGIRLVASLLDAGDAEQLFRRTGMRLGADGLIANPSLPLFLEIRAKKRGEVLKSVILDLKSKGFPLLFPSAYFEELDRNSHLRGIAVQLVLSLRSRSMADVGLQLRNAVAKLLAHEEVTLALPNPLQPTLEGSLSDMEMPPNRVSQGQGSGASTKLTGQGVIVGVIDDGCALAHPNFLKPGTLQSRILYLWDQAGATPKAGDPPSYWSDPLNFPGRELQQANIDKALAAFVDANGRVMEGSLYEALEYDLDRSAHGTHVLDIAAGNGGSLFGGEGVANEADIIFVQLPRQLVDQGGPALEVSILDGVAYVFARALKEGKQAVVNISLGGYGGPHNGTSPLAIHMDELLQGMPGRAVVVSAGNGYEADCHATGTVNPGVPEDRVWLLRPENPISNQLEIWYDGATDLPMQLKPPGRPALPPVALNKWKVIRRTSDNQVIGWIQHEHVPVMGPGNPSNRIRINLARTAGEDLSHAVAAGVAASQQVGQGAPALPAITGAAPSGAWTVRLHNRGDRPPAEFHAWIERDDNRLRRARRGQQSRFQDADVVTSSTVADIGTGKFVICVGAHNAATSEMCRYSACGPTRDNRPKPDVTAPAQETASGGGVLSASALNGQPTRMGGTSAAAPHVTGLVALIMQANIANPLTAKQILAKLTTGATSAQIKGRPPERKLHHNTHQEVDDHRVGKRQSGHFPMVIGAGKVNITEST